MSTKTAYVDYQALAAEIAVGDVVVPYGRAKDWSGRVVAVYPAIGMVDVEFFHGNKRYPVEELQRFNDAGQADPPDTETVPGGAGTVSVSGGPVAPASRREAATSSPRGDSNRVAQAFLKQALYWAARDRTYRATAEECATGVYHCPKCRQRGIDSVLRKAVFRREEGRSDQLYGCPNCMWLITREAILANREG